MKTAAKYAAQPTDSTAQNSRSIAIAAAYGTPVNNAIASLARRIAGTTSRVACCAIGAWLAAVLPVEIWADQRRAANQAAGYLPNLDPGSVVLLAALFAIAALLGVLLIEVSRCWAMGFEPLALPACVALGASASWPVGGAFTVAWLQVGGTGLLLESLAGILAFYALRHAWIVSMGRSAG